MTTTEQHSAMGLNIADTTVTEDYTIGCMAMPNLGGDLRVMWDSRNDDEVASARKQFKDMLTKGYLAYAAEGKDGHRGKQLKEFDPKVERIIMIKPLAGG